MVDRIPNVCDNFGIAILYIDSNYNILDLDINKEIVVLKGKVSGELVGKKFLDIVSEEYRERIKEIIESVKNIGKKETILSSPKGNFWTYMRVSKMGNYFVVLLVDVTGMINEKKEQMKKQNELNVINKFMRNISSTFDIGEICRKAYKDISKYIPNMDSFIISLVDEEMGEIWAEYIVGNGKRYKRRKYSLNDKDTLTGWVAVHRKELYIKNVKEEKLPANYKIIGRVPLSWLGIPLIYRDRIIGVLSVQSEEEDAFSKRDLELLRLMARGLSIAINNTIIYNALKRSKEKYRVLVDNNLIGIVTTNKNDEIKFVNRAMADMLGYTPEEIIGKKIFEFVTEKGKIALREGTKRRLKGISDTYECELVRKDGTIVPVMIYASPYRDEKGNIIGTMGAIADISELKSLENRLRESNEFLKLLLHIIGHDLKNPLFVISGYAELLKEDPNPEYADKILDGVDLVNKMLLDLRSLLRMELEGNQQREEYSLLQLIEDAIAIVLSRYPNAKIENTAKDEKICGIGVLLKEALINILLNAFKHGATEVKIETKKMDGKIIMRIADNGPGISDENKEKIFEPFVKFSSDGSGLGLYIVKKVISLHGGKVWVEDNVPKGTVFVIELPISDGCQ